jgi:hypothetical protein
VGEPEQGADEVAHALRRLVDAPQALMGGLVENVGVVLEQGDAERVYDLQWIAQIVRYGITERLQLPVLPFEFLDQGGAGFGQLGGRARGGRLKLLA